MESNIKSIVPFPDDASATLQSHCRSLSQWSNNQYHYTYRYGIFFLHLYNRYKACRSFEISPSSSSSSRNIRIQNWSCFRGSITKFILLMVSILVICLIVYNLLSIGICSNGYQLFRCHGLFVCVCVFIIFSLVLVCSIFIRFWVV